MKIYIQSSQDSQSAIQAIELYNNNNPLVTEINSWLCRLSSQQKCVHLFWVPSHIGVEGNVKADTEAKDVANSDIRIYYTKLPHRDYYPLIKKSLKEEWQTK